MLSSQQRFIACDDPLAVAELPAAGARYDHCRSPIEKFESDDGRPAEGRQDLGESEMTKLVAIGMCLASFCRQADEQRRYIDADAGAMRKIVDLV